ncbi:FKBP-type peptidyl-prolyl cis-trans isomerase [Viridibacterium curvum]|uniref:Peptidyl-prolyl cis-trans isomerase n=1 Tax=Viridibacterium curvum TaxID=1101404 RepID=A0ABP9QN54_9RHOO
MKKTLVALLTLAAMGSAFAADQSAPAAEKSGMNDDQKTLYAVGVVLGQQLKVFSPSAAELALIQKGIADSVQDKKLTVDMEAYGPRIQPLAQARRVAFTNKIAAAGKAFADKAAKEPGAVKTASGLIYVSQKEGTGPNPGASDIVKVHYRGTLIDGKEFDSSYKRGEPIEFPLTGVIKCWGEGVQKMKAGGKAKLVCPAAIAYGDNGAGAAIPPGATLQFEVELLSFKAAPPAASAPAEAPKK